MNILVACEESQAVTIELRKLGHQAFSCDLIECSGGHPEWHVLEDVLKVLNPKEYRTFNTRWNGTYDFEYVRGVRFKTCDGTKHFIRGKWDMIIAFPPCTHLATSGARHFEKKREDGRQREAIEFFCQFLNADCERIAIENPIGIMSGGDYIKKHFPDLAEKYGLPVQYTQVVHPYYFAKDEDDIENYHEKSTCLWIRGMQPLAVPLVVPDRPERFVTSTGKSFPAWYSKSSLRGKGDRQKLRSKTFPGIAKAMAEQWAGECI